MIRLADKGFSGLWLIGLWERSDASRAIKVKNGNPEAAASAYALKDIESQTNWAVNQLLIHFGRGQPNRVSAWLQTWCQITWVWTAIGWWSIQIGSCNFPTLRTPDIASTDQMCLAMPEIYLEDGYWDQTDAAVVFKCVNHTHGSTRYVYHGNDGTQMPWNDTAQLDYLKPVVREAVIQTIPEVARTFRSTDAMTLARKHIARLCIHLGHGGAIPSQRKTACLRRSSTV